MGDLYRALGQGEQARDAFANSLAIAERLAQADPDRADYQRDLITSLSRGRASSDDSIAVESPSASPIPCRAIAGARPTGPGRCLDT